MKSSSGGNGQLPLILALVGLIFVGGWGIWRAVRSESAGESPHPYRVLGAGVSEEAGKLLGPNAQVVVIVAGGEADPAAEKNAHLFNEALTRHGLRILATETIPFPEIAMGGSPGKRIPGQRYLQFVAKYPAAGAFISLAGYPAFGPASPAPAKRVGPPLVAVVTAGLDPASDGVELQRLLADGFVRLAITRKGDAVPTSSRSSALRAQFDAYYQVRSGSAARGN